MNPEPAKKKQLVQGKKAKNYENFRIGDIFYILTPKRRFNANTLTFGGKYPYVVRTEKNNGIRDYINEDEIYLNEANTISFGQDTATMFFQNVPYFTGDKIKVFKLRKQNLDREIALYLITQMKKAFSVFAWGQSSFNVSVLESVVIPLPVTLKGEIDFKYMERYIREFELARIRELETIRTRDLAIYLEITRFSDYFLTDDDIKFMKKSKKVKYGEFKIGEIFYIFTGRDIIISRTFKGNIPLISHQHANNGISKTIEQINDRQLFKANETIALADRGVFWASVQNTDFHIGTRVKALVFKNGEQSREIRLFFATVINKLQVLFKEYLRNATDSLPDLSIQLPITKNNTPDYDFMEKFIRIQEKLAIKNVMEYNDKVIQATKDVVGVN